ncbi:phytanoyl-CoA dioxygenase family protein [Nioella sp. MMSF_3534]|uniref:phytanoyl-CoA dioxygenase family protein n=1 Tax=Nioella sp. MMSF_3534 TaxID=3046720 RepID=UPI00273D117F|nr:phytanoyl-CoA dioxygenase family protein [Nioella sp. MMSF_3534]
MAEFLTPDQTARYARDGFLHPIRAFDTGTTATLRAEVEALERDHAGGAGGHDLNQFFRVNGQLVIPLLHRIATDPGILDPVSSILGPNLLVWSVELFIKEPGTTKVVSWHQDITYWGMGETDEELTAWLALSDVSVQAGCMRFIPGSHKNAIVPHADTFDADNLLSRGQQIEGINEDEAVFGALKPGEMSFHHGRTFHASGPNMSDDRRIGMAIRYVTPEVRQPDLTRDYAMLVRGKDEMQGWINVAPPARLFDPASLALYDEVLAAQSAALTAGAEGQVGLYAQKMQ